MRKTMFILLLFFFVASVCWAEYEIIPVKFGYGNEVEFNAIKYDKKTGNAWFLKNIALSFSDTNPQGKAIGITSWVAILDMTPQQYEDFLKDMAN